MSANADARKLRAVTRFGHGLGLAFQVIDDILDVTQTSEILGKSAGKDVAAKKATYPAVIGLEKSRAEARRLTRQAHNALSVFRSDEAKTLHASQTICSNASIEPGANLELRVSQKRPTVPDFVGRLCETPTVYANARLGSISSVSFD